MNSFIQHQLEWRRTKVLEMMSKGETNQSEIARILQVDRSTICRDVDYLRKNRVLLGKTRVDKAYRKMQLEESRQKAFAEAALIEANLAMRKNKNKPYQLIEGDFRECICNRECICEIKQFHKSLIVQMVKCLPT